MSSPTTRRRRLGSRDAVARQEQVTVRSVSNWHGAGHIVGYRIAGHTGLLFDLDEVARAAETNPAMRTPRKVKGPVVTLPLSEAVTIVIDPVS
jgi:hypothetical protein